jgi:lambda family phage minor tail protein L
MTYTSESQSLSPSAEIQLFELSDFNPSNRNEVFYFTNAGAGVSFAGVAYQPLACSIEGIEHTGEGSSPQPTFTITDYEYQVSNRMAQFGGLEGSTLTYRKTRKKFLDGQPAADPTAYRIVDSFLVAQSPKGVYGVEIEFKLESPNDFQNDYISRPMIAKCSYIYRKAQCGYAGKEMFDINDKRTVDPKKDKCSKSLTGCSKRFGKVVLPFGGFPSLDSYT